MKNKYTSTYAACFTGIFCQALVINYIPLLFVAYERNFNISVEKISFLITLSFLIQLATDYLAGSLIKKYGYRFSACASQLFSGTGLLLLGMLPKIMSPYTGIVISVCIYSFGAGLIEVVVSPIVEACPGKRKAAAMSLLHSFYCWGQVAVVLISTLMFFLFGMEFMFVMSAIWSIIPFADMILFSKVPIPSKILDEEPAGGVKKLFANRIFLLLLVIMICGGASEMGISQWASAFAEKNLGVSKTAGDILGPCIFAVCMGGSRLLHSLYKGKIPLVYLMLSGGIFAFVGYVLTFLPFGAAIGFAGCAIIGMAVGIMWPGALSMAAESIPDGGAYMYSFLALAGDTGCALGPAVVGFVGEVFSGNLGYGLLCGSLFPLILAICVTIFIIRRKK